MAQGTHFPGQPILAQVLDLVPRGKIQQLARQHRSDRYCKRFMTYDHLVAMLYTIFSGCTSLREVVTGLMACEHRLVHLGVKYTPRRSTLADANRRRDAGVFRDVYVYLYKRYAGSLPDSRSEAWKSKLFIVDSTTITLFQEIMKSAGRTPLSGKRKGGVKAHTLMKANEDVPRLVSLTPASVNDRTFMKLIDLPAGSIVVFDKGYVSYPHYNRLTGEGVTFVTRLQANAVVEILEEHAVEEQEQASGVRHDAKVRLGHKDHEEKVTARRIVYWDEEKERSFEFLTNNMTMEPSLIARFYRQRWQIETLFKRLKQNYPLQYFLGDNPNAIKVQIWCALIADLLLKVIRRRCAREWSFANLASMLRLHLMTYIDLFRFLENPERALQQVRAARGPRELWSLFPT